MDNIQINIDFTAAQTQFEQLMQTIDQTRSRLEGLKKSSAEYKEISQQLKQQEEELVDVMNRLGNQVDYSQVSYRQLSKTMGELNKTAKDTTLENRTKRYTSALSSMNAQLKVADAQIGSYGRNVGNYTMAMTKAEKSLMAQTQQLVRELPSLALGPEMFLLAISNNLPYFADTFQQVMDSMDGASDAGEEFARTNRNIVAGSEMVSASVEAYSAGVAQNTANTIQNTAAQQLNLAQRRFLAAELANLDKQISLNGQALLDEGDILKYNFGLVGLDKKAIQELTGARVNERGELVLTQVEYAKLRTHIRTEIAARGLNTAATQADTAATQANTAANNANASSVSKISKVIKAFGVTMKGLFKPVSLLVLGITLLIQLWPKLKDMFNSMKRLDVSFEAGSRSIKEWNEALREANESAAKSATELIVYSRWATMAAKSDNERTAAADKVVEIMKKYNTEVDIAGVKAGIFSEKIDDVTRALIKQAQAQAMMTTITEKYKKLLDAQSKVYEAESEGITFGDRLRSGLSAAGSGGGKPSDYYERRIQGAKNDAEKAKKEFEGWLENFLKDFNPSDLLLGEDDKDGGKGGADKWYSRWELKIKEREALLQKTEKSAIEYSDKEWWKFTQEGIEYHKNMFEEYKVHYANDEKQLSSALQREKQYYTDYALYVKKLREQYTHPDYQADIDALNEWFELEKQKYTELGLWNEKEADVVEEHRRRLYDINQKYRDEYINAELTAKKDWMSIEQREHQIQLAELDQWFEDEKEAYRRAGKEIVNLETEYNNRLAKINDEYRRNELERQLEYIEAKTQSGYIQNETSIYSNLNPVRINRTGAARNGGYNGSNAANERAAEMSLLTANYHTLMDSLNEQLNLIESAEFETLDEQIQAEQDAVNIKMQLANEEALYKMKMNELVTNDAKEKWNEQMEAVSSTFNVMGDLFGNISSLMAEGSEEAKGFAVASAAMSAIASAVEAYKSTVGIQPFGTILAPIAAASALAAGMANVKQILATKTDGSNAMSSVSGAYVGATPSPISNAIQTQAVATGNNETVNLNSQSIRAFIVDRDLSDGMNKYNSRNKESSF